MAGKKMSVLKQGIRRLQQSLSNPKPKKRSKKKPVRKALKKKRKRRAAPAKPTGATPADRMEQIKMGIYLCPTCGRRSTERGHLCTPVPVKNLYRCEYCGISYEDPTHLCKEKAAKVAYLCDMCGRTAVNAEDVCVPKKIPPPVKE